MGGRNVNDAFSHAVRYLGLWVAATVTLYTALVVFQVIPSTHYSGPVVGLGIALTWLGTSLFYFMYPAKTADDQALRIGVYHALALSLFVMVIGFSQPFSLLFVLLFLATYQYFGRSGFVMSAAGFLFVASLDILLRIGMYPEVVYETGLTAIVTVFVGIAVLMLYHSLESKRRAVVHTHENERMQYNRVLTIMNNLSDAAFSTNEHSEVQIYNAASLDLLDTNDSIKGKKMDTLLHLVDTEGTKVNISDLLASATRSTRRDDLSHQYPDGEAVRLEITFAPIRSNYSKKDGQGGYIVIMRDITKQKSLEEERDEFISVVSHELRTPITIVEGSLSNLEVLANRKTPPAKDTLTTTISTAHEQVLYLAKMVNDLSTLSRAERGIADAPEEIAVSELLHAMHHQYQRDAEQKGLALDLDLGGKLGKVMASRLYLEELLQNFITNAIKYTTQGSVTIIARSSAGKVMFSVKDTGIGISRSDQNKVFNKFYRSEDYRIRETGGTGLGLYVSTKLARKLHTTIELKSRLNHGSTFSFTLPVEPNDLSK